MEIKKYHYQLGLPTVQTKFGVIALTYSFHAQTRARDKAITLFPQINTDTARVIEIEMEGRQVIKILYRIPYNAKYDMLLAIIPDRGFVKTIWLNSVEDKHQTLRVGEYTKL
jgi:hypothetical protein